MKAAIKKLKKASPYIILGILSYLFFLYLTFPVNLIKTRVLNEISYATGMNIDASKMSLGIISGVKLKNVKISSGNIAIKLSTLKVRPSIISLILKKPAASFRAIAPWLDVSGKIKTGKIVYLDINTKKILIKQLMTLMGSNDLLLNGKIHGDLLIALTEKDLNKGDLSKANGQITLKGNNILIEKIPTYEENVLKMLIDPKDLVLYSMSILGDIKNGQIAVKNIAIKSKKFTASGTGEIKLSSYLPSSRLNIKMNFTLDDELLTKIKAFEMMLRDKIKLKGNILSLSIGGTITRPMLHRPQ